MGAIWTEENKYRQWLEVELAASDALAELGEVPYSQRRNYGPTLRSVLRECKTSNGK